MMKFGLLNYFVLAFLNVNPIFGGKLIAVGYLSIVDLNPYISLLVVIVTEIIVCIISFKLANSLKKLKFFSRRLAKINTKWVQKGSYVGFFVGQLFVGELFIALLLGLVEDKKSSFVYFYIPMILSTVLYTLLYYYMTLHGVNLIKSYAAMTEQINLYKRIFKYL